MLSYRKLKDSVIIQDWTEEAVFEAQKEIMSNLIKQKFKQDLPANFDDLVESVRDPGTVKEIIDNIFKIDSYCDINEILWYYKVKEKKVAKKWICEAQKEILLKLLKEKFRKIPPELLIQIEETGDLKKVEKLLSRILKIKSLDDVKKVFPDKSK
jgi:hypothetical protein